MRISDWSSDVCSSDLLAANLASDLLRPSLAPAFVMWAADWFRRSYQGGMQRWADIEAVLKLQLPQSEWRALADRGFDAWGVEPLIKIGRASCRESVGQYV